MSIKRNLNRFIAISLQLQCLHQQNSNQFLVFCQEVYIFGRFFSEVNFRFECYSIRLYHKFVFNSKLINNVISIFLMFYFEFIFELIKVNALRLLLANYVGPKNLITFVLGSFGKWMKNESWKLRIYSLTSWSFIFTFPFCGNWKFLRLISCLHLLYSCKPLCINI